MKEGKDRFLKAIDAQKGTNVKDTASPRYLLSVYQKF